MPTGVSRGQAAGQWCILRRSITVAWGSPRGCHDGQEYGVAGILNSPAILLLPHSLSLTVF